MAITRQNSAVVGNGIAFSSTPSYTVNAASNLVTVAVANANSGGASGVTGITYGGTSMTVHTFKNTIDSTWITLGYLLNPATGANNFAFSGLTGGSITVLASDYSGVGAADGGFVTNNASTASLTTNVSLTNANEWVVAATIAGHPTFVNTTNMVVVQQATFIQSAIQDSGAGFGSGTVGFVTTLSGSNFRQYVVYQAFTASGGSNNGSLAVTFDDFTLAGTGSAPAKGTLAEAFANFTLAGTGTAPAKGSLAEAFADFTLAGTGSAATIGSLAVTFTDFMLAWSGINSVKRFPFYPLDPSIRDAVLVKPYSGVPGDAFGGAPAGAGYPATAAPTPPVQQNPLVPVPR